MWASLCRTSWAPAPNEQGEVKALTITPASRLGQYYVRMEDLLKAACQHAPRNLTLEEWQLTIRSEPYRKTCPNLPPGEGVAEASGGN